MGGNNFYPFSFSFGSLGVSRQDAVWAKGRIVPGWNPNEWRMDVCGSWMRYSEYGQTTTFGWEQDHVDPSGPDELWNLQPLYWRNNRRKSDKSPLAFALSLIGRK